MSVPHRTPSRLQRLDSAAERLNRWIWRAAARVLRLIVGACLIALAVYAGLWVLDLMSFGSELSDWQPFLEFQLPINVIAPR